MDFDVFRLEFLFVRTTGEGRNWLITLTGSSAVGFDATVTTGFNATVMAFEVDIVRIIEDCCVRTKGAVN